MKGLGLELLLLHPFQSAALKKNLERENVLLLLREEGQEIAAISYQFLSDRRFPSCSSFSG